MTKFVLSKEANAWANSVLADIVPVSGMRDIYGDEVVPERYSTTTTSTDVRIADYEI